MREQLIQPRAIPLTCAVDGRSHRVTDQAFGAGLGHGYYQALCGYTVVAAAMVSPDGPPCPTCAQRASGPNAGRPAGRVARRRVPGTLRRLVASLRRRNL